MIFRLGQNWTIIDIGDLNSHALKWLRIHRPTPGTAPRAYRTAWRSPAGVIRQHDTTRPDADRARSQPPHGQSPLKWPHWLQEHVVVLGEPEPPVAPRARRGAADLGCCRATGVHRRPPTGAISRTESWNCVSLRSGLVSSQDRNSLVAPAQLTRISIPPNAASAVAATSCMASAWVRSPSAMTARQPLARISPATASALARLRPRTTTDVSSAASILAMAAPMPLVEPATKARWPSKRDP